MQNYLFILTMTNPPPTVKINHTYFQKKFTSANTTDRKNGYWFQVSDYCPFLRMHTQKHPGRHLSPINMASNFWYKDLYYSVNTNPAQK